MSEGGTAMRERDPAGPPTRRERDALGEVEVPADALWGAATARALENAPVSGERFPRRFLRALALVKQAAARANAEVGALDAETAGWIERAAAEGGDGARAGHFP